jgi:hypothetical protein
MKTFSYECVELAEFCEHNSLDYGAVIEAVNHSDISFGTNYDTLLAPAQLEAILEDADISIQDLSYDNYSPDRILISLGS